MRLLLDTCTFLWFILGDSRIPSTIVSAIVNPSSEVFLSVVSMWEILLKQQIGRLNLPTPAADYVRKQRIRHEIESLTLDEMSVSHLMKLPKLHRDPFDRILICQGMEHDLTLVTPDSQIAAYPVKVLW